MNGSAVVDAATKMDPFGTVFEGAAAGTASMAHVTVRDVTSAPAVSIRPRVADASTTSGAAASLAGWVSGERGPHDAILGRNAPV